MGILSYCVDKPEGEQQCDLCYLYDLECQGIKLGDSSCSPSERSLLLSASDRFDYGALGHLRNVEYPDWGPMEQEGEIRGQKKYTYCPVHS